MLTYLAINNLAIVEHLELDLPPGMTVITGETGAGKSILLDALGLALGDRADADSVRHDAAKASFMRTLIFPFCLRPNAGCMSRN